MAPRHVNAASAQEEKPKKTAPEEQKPRVLEIKKGKYSDGHGEPGLRRVGEVLLGCVVGVMVS